MKDAVAVSLPLLFSISNVKPKKQPDGDIFPAPSAKTGTSAVNRHETSLLAALTQAERESLPIGDIRAIDELQMRRPDAMNPKAKKEDEQARKDLIGSIASSLLDNDDLESTPLKVVVCTPEDNEDVGWEPDSKLNCLVDGFHRLEAYAKAGRKVVPVQRVEGTWTQAQDVASILNNYSKTVPVDKDQQRQQAWEMVNRHIDWESGTIKAPWSARAIAKATHANHQTVNNMVKRAVALGKRASALSWKEARSNREPREFTEHERTKHLIHMTLELRDKAHSEHELGVMLRVLQDEANGDLGYDLDVDKYAEQLLAGDSKDVDAF